jgi:hypothetical protein
MQFVILTFSSFLSFSLSHILFFSIYIFLHLLSFIVTCFFPLYFPTQVRVPLASLNLPATLAARLTVAAAFGATNAADASVTLEYAAPATTNPTDISYIFIYI